MHSKFRDFARQHTTQNTRMEQIKERAVDTVKVLPLHGSERLFDSIEKAITFLNDYPLNDSSAVFVRFEVDVHFKDGTEYHGRFISLVDAIRFLVNRLKGIL